MMEDGEVDQTRILAVDPGKATGYATWWPDIRPEAPFMSGQYAHLDFLDWAMYQITKSGTSFDVVVCENFLITMSTAQKTRGEPWSLKQIGCLEWACHTAGIPFVLQSPSDAKGFAGARYAKLRKLGWYVPGPDHRNDAAAHLLLYLVRQKLFDIKRLVD